MGWENRELSPLWKVADCRKWAILDEIHEISLKKDKFHKMNYFG